MDTRRSRYGLLSIVLLTVIAVFVAFPTSAADQSAASATASAAPTPIGADAKLHPVLVERVKSEGETKAWVFFADKGFATPDALQAAIADVAASYDRRAVERRRLRGLNARRGQPLFDVRDVPVHEDYIAAVTATGARLHVRSSWLNAISVYADEAQLDEIAALPFVDRLEAVRRSRRIDVMNVQDIGAGPFAPEADARGINYGAAEEQLEQINLIELHDAGYTGNGVVIGILDTGFKRSHAAFNHALHPLNVIAEYDFVDGDGNADVDPGDPSSQHNHGTMILGVLGAYAPGSLVGGAYNASFVLCKTEDTTGEYPAEEDNYVAGLQFIEANGCDMSTASLGYIDWYTQADLDGQTAVTTIAVNILTSQGVHHCNAAGNEYHDSNPNTSSLIAPADAFQVITCGAVNSSGDIAVFSSEGPTADGRVKPEVLARGVSTHTVSPYSDSSYTTADGTSLSTPVVACAVACLIDARPHWTVDQMRQHLFETADYFVQHETHDPLYVRGYGIIDAFAAYDTCSDAGIVMLDRTEYACESTAQVLVNDCGLNTDDLAIETVAVTIVSDAELAGETLVLTESAPDSAEFLGTIDLSTTDAAGTLLVAHGNVVTVTYIDADDGEGNYDVVVTETAVVDCLPPVIGNIQAADVQPRSALIAFDADEPVRGTVHYGTSCDALDETADGTGYSTTPSVGLSGLQDNTLYYYAVSAEDEAGNAVYDDNGGACYSFQTPEVPDFFTEIFEGSGNDLAWTTLEFRPNGSNDFYGGCTAAEIDSFPTDPAGGTPLSLSDDDNEAITLTGGATVSLYGTTYGTVYVGSNGYVTFAGGETGYTESLENHFSVPRVSMLYDDLNPSSGGTISYKQLADRLVVTYENVPEYSNTGANSFQIELFFDGAITINYLDLTASDGLAGLSAGNGLDPEFFMSDLSNLGVCQPEPPVAYGDMVEVGTATAVEIELQAGDDGLPDPPAALSYTVESLPVHGLLFSAAGSAITSAPHTLADNTVTYISDAYYVGSDAFTFSAHDGGEPPLGGASNVATVGIDVVGGQARLHNFSMDSDPGWSTEGDWEYGVPQGLGSHGGDPQGGHTGSAVYGTNLAGDYPNNMDRYYLTTTAIDCSHGVDIELRFARWLALQGAAFDGASLEVSNNGVDWTMLWEHDGGWIVPAGWNWHTFDISAVADEQPTVYLRWGMGPTDAMITYPGWNIDDVELWGIALAPGCTGDANCDGAVNWRDIDFFVAGMNDDVMAWRQMFLPQLADCPFSNLDANGDGGVNWRDIDVFVSLQNTTCP